MLVVQVRSENKTTVLIPPITQLTLSEPKPVFKYVKAFAPATVANLGPGFDFLGCAVNGLGDLVTAQVHSCMVSFLPHLCSTYFPANSLISFLKRK